MFAVIFFVGVSMVRPEGPALPTPTPTTAPGIGPGTTDLSSMSPREAADRLFNRVMTAASNGDSVEMQGFMPMAISAYEQARPLDLDGLFHLSMLNRTAGAPEEALSNAAEVLEVDPDHLLGLAAAAEAAIDLGRVDEAAGYYRHLLDVFDQENARALNEYVSHSTIVSALRSEAEAFLAGR
jgi:tetratricopeptide (TPR) repeat protein